MREGKGGGQTEGRSFLHHPLQAEPRGQRSPLPGRHCAAPAVGTAVLRLLAAERTGEPASGPRAVEAGRAAIPVQETQEGNIKKKCRNTFFFFF